MGEKKTTPITIDDVQYVLEDMKPEQQAMVNHIADLDRKIGSTQFNLEQLQVGKQAFIDMLKKSLDSDVVEIKEAA
jgi:restriction endonuclease S subunit